MKVTPTREAPRKAIAKGMTLLLLLLLRVLPKDVLPAVVFGLLFGVRQHVVSLTNILKLLRRLLLALFSDLVGVPLECELAVCFLDLGGVGDARDAEDFVVILRFRLLERGFGSLRRVTEQAISTV